MGGINLTSQLNMTEEAIHIINLKYNFDVYMSF